MQSREGQFASSVIWP
nr:unnamed protein product [Callosobruchus chinensis]